MEEFLVPLIFRSTGVDVNHTPTYGHPLSFSHTDLLWLADEFNRGSIHSDIIVARYNLSERIIAQVKTLNSENPFSFLDYTGYMAVRAAIHFVNTLETSEQREEYITKLLSDQQLATIERDAKISKP